MQATGKTLFKIKRLFIFFLCGSQVIGTTLGLKECIEPLRVTSSGEEVPVGPPSSAAAAAACISSSSEFAIVPKKICGSYDDSKNDDAQCHRNYNNNNEGSEACAVVVEGLFADWRMLDGAIMLSGTCQGSISQGKFYAKDSLRLLPPRNNGNNDDSEVIAIRVLGRDLIHALEEKLTDYYTGGNAKSYPHTAGFQYDLDLSKPKGHRIQNMKMLGFMCNWKPIQNSSEYMILTDRGNAKSLFPLANTSSPNSISGTGRSSAESFFLYATSVCKLENNWHKMRLKFTPPQPRPTQQQQQQQEQQQTMTALMYYPLPATLLTSPPSPSPFNIVSKERRTIKATQ